MTKDIFFGKTIYSGRFINFQNFQSLNLKNELKYYFLHNFKEGLLKDTNLYKLSKSFKYFTVFANKKLVTLNSFSQVQDKEFSEWVSFLIRNGISISDELKQILNVITYFIKDFYDDREETEKDIWYAKNIPGVKYRASSSKANKCLNFNSYLFVIESL